MVLDATDLHDVFRYIVYMYFTFYKILYHGVYDRTPSKQLNWFFMYIR